jgi:cell wall-associated NlpC family hydrolase
MEPGGDTGLLERGAPPGGAEGAPGGLPDFSSLGDIPWGGDAPPAPPIGDLGDEGAKVAVGGAVAIGGLTLLPLILIMLGVAVLVGFLAWLNPFDGGGDGTWAQRWPVTNQIPAVYKPMYEAAGKKFGVNPFLLASIHMQETGFSTNPTVRAGTNSSGAAGPMQFLLTTWVSHDKAFKSIESARPESYPLNRKTLPSCAGVPADLGCVYDDFDAIAGAAHKLAADGADMSLTSAGTRRAVCAYIGACSEVDQCTGSINQYCQVLPRARKWALEAGPIESAPGKGAEGAVGWALQQDGTMESPLGSNCGGSITGWQRRTGTPCGTAWCGVFVHEAFLRAGIDLPNWIASVPTTLANAQAGRGGLKAVPKNQIKRGDIVIFQWDTGRVDHMGLAAQDWPGTGRLATIEGNTSNGVHRRSEREGTIVSGVRVVEGGR